jgi:hypothetical protein
LELIKVAIARIEHHTYFHRSPENLQYSTQLMTIPPLSKPGSNQVASVLPVLPVQQDAQYPFIHDVRANINSTGSSNLMRRLRENPCDNRPLTDRVQVERNESRITDNHRRIIHSPKRRIVIGYVFGSKKMSTMSVVMAEASKVKLYYSKRTGKIATATCHAAGSTFTDTTSASASTASPDCTTTTTSTTEGCCDVPNTNSKSKNHPYFFNHCNDRPSNGDSVDATEDTMAFVTATKSTASSSHSYCSSFGTTLTQARLSKHSMDHNCHLTSDQVGKPMTIPTMDRSDRTTTTTTTNTDTTSHKVDSLTNTIVVTPNSSSSSSSSSTTNSASSRVSWSSCCTGQSSSTTSSSSSSSSTSTSSPREEEDEEEEEDNQYDEFIPIRVSFVPLDLGTFVAGWYFFLFFGHIPWLADRFENYKE